MRVMNPSHNTRPITIVELGRALKEGRIDRTTFERYGKALLFDPGSMKGQTMDQVLPRPDMGPIPHPGTGTGPISRTAMTGEAVRAPMGPMAPPAQDPRMSVPAMPNPSDTPTNPVQAPGPPQMVPPIQDGTFQTPAAGPAPKVRRSPLEMWLQTNAPEVFQRWSDFNAQQRSVTPVGQRTDGMEPGPQELEPRKPQGPLPGERSAQVKSLTASPVGTGPSVQTTQAANDPNYRRAMFERASTRPQMDSAQANVRPSRRTIPAVTARGF